MLRRFIFNLKEAIHHSPLENEVELIKKTNLFATLDEKHFKEMLKDVRLIKYPAGKLIFQQGEQESAFYILVDGSVLVYALDHNQQKIPIARLNKGEFFGDIALLGQGHKSRDANIETITEITLLRIDAKFINYILNTDSTLSLKWRKSGSARALKMLSKTTGLYDDIESMVSEISNPQFVDLNDSDVIFRAGDKPDDIYLILEGRIDLIFSDKETGTTSSIILHKGQLFGELGVLHDKPRSATAVSKDRSRLLKLNGTDFKKNLARYPRLQNMLAKLVQLYQLPRQGSVKQYFGQTAGKPTVTNFYQLNDGRAIVSSKMLNEDVFTMQQTNAQVEKRYMYKTAEKHIELDVHENFIVGIKSYGDPEDLPQICHLMINHEKVDDAVFKKFETTGQIKLTALDGKSATDGSEIICFCMSVTKQRIQDLIDEGVTDLPSIERLTGACTSCRGCEYKILEMIGINPWLSAKMRKFIAHNSYINGYYIKTDNRFSSFKPGQHVIIQIKINEHWVERPYTVTHIDEDNQGIRIAVKKEAQGLMTGWLFEKMQEDLSINVSQPQGEFILNPDENRAAICFAGGVGITPFIAYINSLVNSKKRLHLLYSALTENDFICTNEFREILEKTPTLTIDFWATDKNGLLDHETIIKKVNEFEQPDVYICGPEGFVDLVQKTLRTINYDDNKIHIEKFVHAGTALKH